MYIGECKVGRDGCFECGEIGHKRKDCLMATKKRRERAQVVLTTMNEVP